MGDREGVRLRFCLWNRHRVSKIEFWQYKLLVVLGCRGTANYINLRCAKRIAQNTQDWVLQRGIAKGAVGTDRGI